MNSIDLSICKELSVLLVEDDYLLRDTIGKLLSKIFKNVFFAENGKVGIAAFIENNPDLVVTDIKMPILNGLEMAKKIRKIKKTIPVIVTTAFSETKYLIEAIDIGIDAFVKKPYQNNLLLDAIYKCTMPIAEKNKYNLISNSLSNSLENRIGSSRKMKTVISYIKKVANTDFSIILQGETGVGKTLIASIIHEFSKRSKEPFVTVDIGSIPKELVEKELFGHKKGAFTDAYSDKIGYLEAANGGTIFLEELENLSKDSQAKLLRVVEERIIYPLGSTHPVPIDIRIISATNINIKTLVKKGIIREDLFYRLSEFEIMIPPLRERKEEIRTLSEKFYLGANKELNKGIKNISEAGFEILEKQNWNGNIRELKNVIRRATLLSEDYSISTKEIKFALNDINITDHGKTNNNNIIFEPMNLVELEEYEKQYISYVLKLTNYNKMKTANILNVNYQRFKRKLKKHRLS